MIPALCVREFLIREGLGTADGDWSIFISYMPAEPDQAMCVYDQAPKDDGRLMKTGERIVHPGVQILLRGFYPDLYEKAQDVCELLDRTVDEVITIGDITVTLHAFTRTSGILTLGTETEGTKRRQLLSLNYISTFYLS